MFYGKQRFLGKVHWNYLSQQITLYYITRWFDRCYVTVLSEIKPIHHLTTFIDSSSSTGVWQLYDSNHCKIKWEMGNRLHDMSQQLRKWCTKPTSPNSSMKQKKFACLPVRSKSDKNRRWGTKNVQLRGKKSFEVIRLVPYFSLLRAAGTVVMEGELVLHVLQHKIEISMYKVELILKSPHFMNPRWYTKTFKSKYSENVSSFIEHLMLFYYLYQPCSCCASNASQLTRPVIQAAGPQ